MANGFFRFKQFAIRQEHAAFRVTTDSVLPGAWAGFEGVQVVLDAGTGTGTGILALMAAQRNDAQIVVADTFLSAVMVSWCTIR